MFLSLAGWLGNRCLTVVFISSMQFLKLLLRILLTPIVTFLLPILGILSIPILTLRWIVFKLAGCFGPPGLGKMLNSLASIHALSSERGSGIVPFIFEGDFDPKIKDKVIPRILGEGRQKYPELFQTVTSFLGYYFWKDVPNFDINQCLRILSIPHPVDMDSPEGTQIIKDLLETPFQFGKDALWEVTVIPQVVSQDVGKSGPFFCVLLRLHHAIGDVNACISLFDNFAEPQMSATFIRSQSSLSPSPVTVIWQKLCILLKMPVDIAGLVTSHIFSARDPLEMTERKQSGKLVFRSVKADFSISRIRRIAHTHNVSFTSILATIISGVVAKQFTKRKGCTSHTTSSISLQLGPSTQPKKLRNFGKTGIIPLPIHEQDPHKRLKIISQSTKNLRSSTLPIFTDISGRVSGALPTIFLKFIMNTFGMSTPTIGLSNVPWGLKPVSYLGYRLDRFGTSAVNVSGTKLLLFAFGSTGDSVSLSVQADSGIFSEDCLEEIGNDFVEELKFLETLQSQEIV